MTKKFLVLKCSKSGVGVGKKSFDELNPTLMIMLCEIPEDSNSVIAHGTLLPELPEGINDGTEFIFNLDEEINFDPLIGTNFESIPPEQQREALQIIARARVRNALEKSRASKARN